MNNVDVSKSRRKVSTKPIMIAFLVIGFFSWWYDFVYDELWDKAQWEPLDNRTALIYGIGAGVATAFTIAYVTNSRMRQVEQILDKLEKVKIPSNYYQQRTNEKRYSVGSIVGYLSVPATIAFASGLSISYSDQPITLISIFLGSIAIGLAIAIFALQQNQSGKIKEVIDAVNQTNKEMHQVLSGKRQRIADLILMRLIEFEKGYQHVMRVYPDYKKESTPKMLKDITYEQIFGWTERAQYLDVKGCDDPIMYDSFSEPIPSMYRYLLENAFAVSATRKDEGVETAVDRIMELREQMQPLIKELLKYATPEAEFEETLEYYRTQKF